MKTFFDLTGNIIIVTGGNGGLGKGIVEALENAGAIVLIVGRSVNKERSYKSDKKLYRGDISSVTDIERIFSEIYRLYSKIDGLVNCAGVYSDNTLNTDTFYSTWKNLVDINLTGTAICANTVSKYMKRSQSGKIINFGSSYSEFGHLKSQAYTATKTGIIGLSRALAAELGPWGICVNSILPGWFDTKMNEGVPDSCRGDFIKNVTPLQRWGLARDLSGIVTLLCSRGSDFITSAEIRVDGGYAISDRDYRHG